METEATVRPATLKDAERIFALIARNTDRLVPRSLGSIVENIDRFVVAECQGTMAGCAAYQIHPEIGNVEAATVEIVSLAVKSMLRRRGIGRLLVEAVIANARRFSPREVIALTSCSARNCSSLPSGSGSSRKAFDFSSPANRGIPPKRL